MAKYACPRSLIGTANRVYRLNMAKYACPISLSGTANRACDVRFRSKTEDCHILSYSVYCLFITYFTPNLLFVNSPTVIYNYNFEHFKYWQYLKCSKLSETIKTVNSFGKDRGDILLIQINKQTWENDVYILASKDH